MNLSVSAIKRLGLSLIVAAPVALGALSNAPAAAASCVTSVSGNSSSGGTLAIVTVKG